MKEYWTSDEKAEKMVEAEVVRRQQGRWLASCFRGLQISLIGRLRQIAAIKQKEPVPPGDRDLAPHEHWK